MCWETRRRTVQRRQRLQGDLPRRLRRDGHDHRRQLFRLLQEGSKDADQLRRQPLRSVPKRSTPAARSRFRPMCSARNSCADRTVSLKPATLEDALQILGDSAELQPGGYAMDRRYPGRLSTSRKQPNSTCAKAGSAGIARDERHELPLCVRTRSTFCRPATGSGSRSRLAGTAWRLVGTRPRRHALP